MYKYLILALSFLLIAGCENKPLIECQTKNQQLENEISVMEEKLLVSLQVTETIDAKAKAKIEELKKVISASNDEAAKLKDSIAEIKTDMNGKLNSLMQKLKKAEEAAKIASNEAANEAAKNIADITEKLLNTEQQQSKSKQELDQANQKLTEAENKLKAAQAKIEELTNQVEVLQKEKAELLEQLNEKQKAIAEQNKE